MSILPGTSFAILSFLAATLSAQPTHNLPSTLAAPNTAILTILTGLNGSGGIAADEKGMVTIAETPASRAWRLPVGGAKQLLPAANGLTTRGLVYDGEGRLLFCQDDKLSYFDAAGTVHDLAVKRSDGGKLGHNNDLVVLDDGSIYFSNGDGNTIYYWHSGADPIVAASGLNYPDGIEARESAGKVYVTLYSQPYALASFDIQADHTLGNKQILATLGIPDGLVLDSQGNFYVTSLAEGCVAVFSPAGKELGRISVPGENLHNASFGGPHNDTLYFTGEHAAFKMAMKVTGQRDPFRVATGLRLVRTSQGTARSFPGYLSNQVIGFPIKGDVGVFRDPIGRFMLPLRTR
ncbi:MAG: gluconolactonase [Fibrobacteres bacterium]|nr:gluconolactonase [Fibrobacterota bacterium]